MYIAEGQGHHYVDFKKYAYKKGDLIVVQKNQVHHYEVNMDVKGYIVHINEPFFYNFEGFNTDQFFDLMDFTYETPIVNIDTSKEESNRILIDLIYREYNKPKEKINETLMASLFQSFILSIEDEMIKVNSHVQTKDYDHFKHYRKLVEKHYTETRSVEDYAQMMHLSKKTINQATRNVVGLSAKQYIIDRVILEIKRYLSQGELMNYEIADLLGFDEAANMTKFFKHYVKMSPKEFKASL